MNASVQSAAPTAMIQFRSLPGNPRRDFYLFVPPNAVRSAPPLVVVHGIRRRAVEQITWFASCAERLGLILIAPVFGKREYGQYQQVIDRKGNRCDVALLNMVEAVASETGCDADRFHLFGYSGGAQFTHRMGMIHPDRVRSMSIAAAGWYTMPDTALKFPYGIRTHPLAGCHFSPERFLAIDRHVFVGGADHSNDDALRSSPILDEQQGSTRLERAVNWASAMDMASDAYGATPPRSTFDILERVGHSFSSAARRRRLPERVLRNIRGDGD